MIKMLTAYTKEIDEIDDAIQEIKSQLDLSSLLKNSVGILYCHSDFIDSGIVKALSESFPFDIIGMTTVSSATGGTYSVYGLNLSILTSDDIEFTPVFTDSLTADNYEEKIKSAYDNALGISGEKPAFILTYLPYLSYLSGAYMVNALDKATDGLPLYGSVCYGVDFGGERSATILNGENRADAIAMLLIKGDIEPAFKSVALPEQHIRSDRVIVTESSNCVLKKVNGMPIMEYLESVGYFLQKGAPLMVYYESSNKPVALAIYAVNEDGSMLCGGETPEGSSIALGDISRVGILETAEESIKTILSSADNKSALIFPCSVRYFVLFPDQDEEIKMTADRLGGKIPYALAYSGGEVCPVEENGILRNRFHNFTYCSCVF